MNLLKRGFTSYTMTLGVLLAGFAPAKCSSKGCNKQTTKEKQKDLTKAEAFKKGKLDVGSESVRLSPSEAIEHNTRTFFMRMKIQLKS